MRRSSWSSTSSSTLRPPDTTFSPLSSRGVMRCRDHHPRRVPPVLGDECQARRGDDAELLHIGPDRRQAGAQGGDQHVSGPARVLPDHHATAVTVQQVAHRPTEVIGQYGRQVDVGGASDPIRSEEATHQPGAGVGVAAGRSAPSPTRARPSPGPRRSEARRSVSGRGCRGRGPTHRASASGRPGPGRPAPAAGPLSVTESCSCCGRQAEPSGAPSQMTPTDSAGRRWRARW